jgi:hypothetical protein
MAKKEHIRGIPVSVDQLCARPDVIDFRDQMYEATLVEVPRYISLEKYLGYYKDNGDFILNQGSEGACTGFGLAAVANFLLRRRVVESDPRLVSPRMLYEMAKRYDEWPGEEYSGSSARGAMKGWHKHGVCREERWPYMTRQNPSTLTRDRALDAAERPLGAYFRVNHQNLTAMHSALAEVGILYASASVHDGWGQIDKNDGVIPRRETIRGGHAFALVGYDDRGFWLQNSWSAKWGKDGFALITYEDWLANATDVWVARLGAPVRLGDRARGGAGAALATQARAEYSFHDLRPHIVSIGNDGALRSTGQFGTAKADVDQIFTKDIPSLTKGWKTKRLLLYAHGGLVGEPDAIQRVAEYRPALLEAEVYPLSFIWKTDFWTTVSNILKDALSRRRPEGFLDNMKDFMLDRLDDSLEPIARPLGKALWGEMKENAERATTTKEGGARYVLDCVDKLVKSGKWEIHIAGHSAGSIFLGPIVDRLCSSGPKQVDSCTLWAPACTMAFFKDWYLPSLRSGALNEFSLFTLKDAAEQDDNCGNIYHKSLLYLVSHAFEEHFRVFFGSGEPLLGMEKHIFKEEKLFKVDPKAVRKDNPPVVDLFGAKNAQWVRSPNGLTPGLRDASHARRHGDFDDDGPTVRATLARILGIPEVKEEVAFKAFDSTLRSRRRAIELETIQPKPVERL